jgi:hypothetical protein
MSDLIAALLKDRPKNPNVIAFRQTLAEDFALPADDFEEVRIPAHWNPKASGLEALVQKANVISRADTWREQMAIAERRVCHIEAPAGTPIGTGFLVGSDLVLTNCHVYRLATGKALLARFDYGQPGAKGVTRGFRGKRPVAISTEDKLDFALLRLDEPMEDGRGWFQPKSHKFVVGQVHLILQHPDGGPLSLGIGRVMSVLGLPPRVTYDTNTKEGSSGSPAFTTDWQLVAIHHWGGEENNAGIPMSAIWQMLANKNLV